MLNFGRDLLLEAREVVGLHHLRDIALAAPQRRLRCAFSVSAVHTGMLLSLETSRLVGSYRRKSIEVLQPLNFNRLVESYRKRV